MRSTLWLYMPGSRRPILICTCLWLGMLKNNHSWTMIIYNRALAKRTFWLANRPIHLPLASTFTSFCLFLCFFYAIIFMDKHNSHFSYPKIWKNPIIFPDVRNVILLFYKISSLNFLPGLHLRDLIAGVKSAGWKKELGGGPKQQQTDLYQPFEVSNAKRNFRENFSAIWRQ